MIKNSPLLDKFEREQLKKETHTYSEALKIFELLLQEAKDLGVIEKLLPLEGIETDIKVAKILASLK